MGAPEGKRGLGTRSVHLPNVPGQDGDALAPSLDLSSTFSFERTDDFAKASQEKVGAGYVYTRWANPTTDLLEAAVAGLEGAAAAEAFASG
ncbi:MAG TPA: PLP-dependent transferase, partial [Actinomycetota bacterium]|nr:PLP-dependent transferase [Actinomycetota bacterium]